MEGNYSIDVKISRERAREFLARLATDPDFKAQVEADPNGALRELNITFDPELFPEGSVKLPPNKEIEHILYAGDSVWPESASPFGWLIVFVFGAMPVTEGRPPSGDGAG
jgi:hypothetical protein